MSYKSYKYRLYPNKEQQILIEKHIGCCRWMYNYGLDLKIKSYQIIGKSQSRFQIQDAIPSLKSNEDTKWLSEVNSQSLQASLEHLDQAFTKFFKLKLGFPKFKSKHNASQSFEIPQNTKVDFMHNAIKIPKFKKSIKCKFHREFEGIIRKSTISRTPTGKYFIAILVETNTDTPNKKPICENQAVGIDLGIKTFATLSNGVKIDNPKNLGKSISRVKLFQRRVSRKVKGSKSRKKAVKRLAILHEKIYNRRNDFLNKTVNYLVTNFDTICLETLRPKQMMQNHILAQALSDISIGRFNMLIEQKAVEYGTNIIRIGQFEPSSKMCSCGIINNSLKLSQRTWTCECGLTHDRDLLASNNIKRFAFMRNNTAGTAEIHAK